MVEMHKKKRQTELSKFGVEIAGRPDREWGQRRQFQKNLEGKLGENPNKLAKMVSKLMVANRSKRVPEMLKYAESLHKEITEMKDALQTHEDYHQIAEDVETIIQHAGRAKEIMQNIEDAPFTMEYDKGMRELKAITNKLVEPIDRVYDKNKLFYPE